ncbi:hypothetical protein P280DRAFT_523620 [Massarina eburnea CBS 473.64]|uniref:Uncharacterized protein n=1 Tax=Massarina eburnea CBS 473.64 TaxID=1395130 RepID=A0A6A6RIN8_9PLEO|nr:hypothetical protein P280DRAFT_523620 [Massarina eburnea CBS 473.64]
MTQFDDYGMPMGVAYEPESFTHYTWRAARAFAVYTVKPEMERRWMVFKRRDGGWKGWFTLVKVCVLVWWVVVYWGERSAIQNSVEECRWENWENWDSSANPHRLIFVADPQLIDPHTYPGRPWPLDRLTMIYVDQYLRRTFSRFQHVLYPDSVVFLGDLFDGGREWSTTTSQSPEKRYQKYGEAFWLNEYRRFGGIFFDHWGDAGMAPRTGQPGRKMITSLPGNHDLGFAQGVQIGVRKRYNAYFGDGNRIDILGNHTFVSIDSVSLSALGQESPNLLEDIWKPTVDFLDKAKTQKKRLVQRELRVRKGLTPYPGFEHRPLESEEIPKALIRHGDDHVTEFPTVLLSHVPLYRTQGTPCGPMREHWPPTPVGKGQEPLEKDDRNSIPVRGGYQYQNVLNPEITTDIANKVGDIQYAFSGDDHDYCELVHRGYASAGGGIKEITVKSISWCMGVRHPGVLLVSMWNPVDEHGAPLNRDGKPTLQTHLCLMPDQLGIFIRYAALLSLTLFALGIRATLITTGTIKISSQNSDDTLLPTTTSSAEHEKAALYSSQPPPESTNATHSSNSSSTSERGNLQVRNAQARTRTVPPANGYGYALPQQDAKYAYPLIQHAGYYGSSGDDREGKNQARAWGTVNTKKSKVKKRGLALWWEEFIGSLGRAALFVFAWYFWLIWRW